MGAQNNSALCILGKNCSLGVGWGHLVNLTLYTSVIYKGKDAYLIVVPKGAAGAAGATHQPNFFANQHGTGLDFFQEFLNSHLATPLAIVSLTNNMLI